MKRLIINNRSDASDQVVFAWLGNMGERCMETCLLMSNGVVETSIYTKQGNAFRVTIKKNKTGFTFIIDNYETSNGS